MLLFPSSWPQALCTTLSAHLGTSMSIEPLNAGQSQAMVWRVRSPQQSIIVKQSTQPRESLFYSNVAPLLLDAGIPVPHLAWSDKEADLYWLVLEDIPTPLPRSRWIADQEVLAVLRRIHQRLALNLTFPAFEPGWSDAMTHNALACFQPPQAHHLAALLNDTRLAHQELFTPGCWISGDPNPTNWGLRQDGTVVLYDWDRFGKGTPALDLAITVPGLGDMASFQAVATRYLELDRQPSPQEAQIFARKIAIAKIWSVIEYFGHYHTGAIAQSPHIDNLIPQIPAWIESIISSTSEP